MNELHKKKIEELHRAAGLTGRWSGDGCMLEAPSRINCVERVSWVLKEAHLSEDRAVAIYNECMDGYADNDVDGEELFRKLRLILNGAVKPL